MSSPALVGVARCRLPGRIGTNVDDQAQSWHQGLMAEWWAHFNDDFRIHELAKYIDWWQDLVVHDGPIFENGYYRIRDKPGYGVDLNEDVARAHLAPGEIWWG